MNILYVFAHPNSKSFNATLMKNNLDFLKTHQVNVQVSDLYAQQFNAVASWQDFSDEVQESQYFLAQQQAYQQHTLTADINAEIAKIKWADHIILQFPLWWFSTPAILKGWLDRVLVKGFAYDAGKMFKEGLLKGKTASLMVTTQSPESAFQNESTHHATIDVFLHHIHHTLRFVGIETLAPFVVYAAFNLDEDRQQQILKDQHNYLKDLLRI